MAVQQTLLVTIWTIAQADTPYDDLGADFYTRTQPDRAKRRALRELQTVGYTVILDRTG